MGSPTSKSLLCVCVRLGRNRVRCAAHTFPAFSLPITYALPEYAGPRKSDQLATWILYLSSTAAATAAATLTYFTYHNTPAPT